MACKVADGTEQLALVFGRIVVDNGNFGMAVVAEAVGAGGGGGGGLILVGGGVGGYALG